MLGMRIPRPEQVLLGSFSLPAREKPNLTLHPQDEQSLARAVEWLLKGVMESSHPSLVQWNQTDAMYQLCNKTGC